MSGVRQALYGQALGVGFCLQGDDPLALELAWGVVPPEWRTPGRPRLDCVYSLEPGYRLWEDQTDLGRAVHLDDLPELFEHSLHQMVARRALDLTFIHAGAVTLGNRAVLIPGPSRSGKSTLVQALQAVGAQVYSDEYAVLDAHGRVHPYPRPVKLRPALGEPGRRLATAAGLPPAPVGLILVTRFRPEARFSPRPMPASRAALELVRNAVTMQLRPGQCLAAVRLVTQGARAFRSPRGEARAAAARVLELL